MRRTKEQIAADLRLLAVSVPVSDPSIYNSQPMLQCVAHASGVEDCLHQVVEPLLKRIRELEGTLPK